MIPFFLCSCAWIPCHPLDHTWRQLGGASVPAMTSLLKPTEVWTVGRPVSIASPVSTSSQNKARRRAPSSLYSACDRPCPQVRSFLIPFERPETSGARHVIHPCPRSMAFASDPSSQPRVHLFGLLLQGDLAGRPPTTSPRWNG